MTTIIQMTDQPTESLPEMRRHVRKRLNQLVHVYQTDNGLPAGRIVNISKQGFMLSCQQPFKPEHAFKLSVELPEVDNTRTIHLTAQCMWCQPSDANDQDAGFHIEVISDQDQVALNYFLREF